MSKYTKELIEYINDSFNDDIKHNYKVLFNDVLPYIHKKDYSIDESIELLENCPKLLNTINSFNKNNSEKIKESPLYSAYNLINNNEELEELEDYDKLTYYFNDISSSSQDLNYYKIYLMDISKYKVLTDEESHALFEKFTNGNNDEKIEAKQEIIAHNLKLVVAMAKKYANRGIDILDLIQEGNIGLDKAVNRYDYKKGYKFSTYATYWIKQAVQRYIAEHGRTVRLPVYISELMNVIKRTEEELLNEKNAEPTLQEISERCGIPVEKILQYKTNSQSITSLDIDLSDESSHNEYSLIENIPDYDEELQFLPDKMVLEEFKNRILNGNILTFRQRKVIEMRFGLIDGVPRTLQYVGDSMNVTRERIRQIEVKALKSIKAYISRSKYFIDAGMAKSLK